MAKKQIYGVHAVSERLASNQPIDKVFVRTGDLSTTLNELCDQLRRIGVPVLLVPVERLDNWTHYANHQGVLATIAAVETQRLDRIIPMVYEEGRLPLFVWLDGVTDVRNAGAIARTCLEMGADALLLPVKGGPPLSADMMKTSAGALNYLPVCRIGNTDRHAEILQQSGIRLVACTEKADLTPDEAELDGPLCVIMGSEGTGISNSLLRASDVHVRIPTFGPLGSLNVSVATGIVLYEIQRRRKTQL